MDSQHRVLVVDDEPDIRELLTMSLSRMDVASEAVGTIQDARRQISSGKFDLCLTDMRLPDGNGIELVRYIQADQPNLPVAIITAYGNIETAVDALKAGAFDFVSKPIKLNELRNLVSTVLKIGQLPAAQRSKHTLLGESEPIERIRAMITKCARSQAPVYIHGESGTGKELVARLIHEQGPRSDKPFLAINCGAIPPELMESEFFGHKKGSFTGAVSDKLGLFQAADEGTLFLDEVVELPLSMQVKLLRAIQERSVRPVGVEQEIPVDVRILSASQQPLSEQVSAGQFRSDLYYRINVIELEVPPLREHREDIRLLAQHILNGLSEENGQQITVENRVYEELGNYPFPGNVRELENILERASAMSENNRISTATLQLPAHPETGVKIQNNYQPGQEPLEGYLARLEKQALLDALKQCQDNKTEAAKLLGLSFRSFRYKLEKYKL